MTPWVAAWERQCSAQPGALAVVNDRGQNYTYGDLRARATALEHRYNFLGLEAGDRLLVSMGRHQSLDDVVVALWACGLRGACMAPHWKDFTKAQVKEWNLLEEYAPRLRVDADLGEERVFPLPGSFVHDMALAWPERRMDGAGRSCEKVEWKWITHIQLEYAISRLRLNMDLHPGDRIAWMDSGLGGLGWLSVFCALSAGSTVMQVPILARRNFAFFDAWMELSPCDWLVPSPDWCAYAGAPNHAPSKGVISAWGQALPHVRKNWGARARWLDIWAPASCGWWWGCQEWDGSNDEPYLPDHQDALDWHFEAGILHAKGPGALALAVQDEQGAHTGVHLSLSNLADYSSRQAWHRALLKVRQHPRVGDIRSMEINGQHWVGVLPRCADENSADIMDDIRDRLLESLDQKHMRHTRLVVAEAFCPRDETGFFDVLGARPIKLR